MVPRVAVRPTSGLRGLIGRAACVLTRCGSTGLTFLGAWYGGSVIRDGWRSAPSSLLDEGRPRLMMDDRSNAKVLREAERGLREIELYLASEASSSGRPPDRG